MILFLTTIIVLEHLIFMLIEIFAKPELQSKSFDLPTSFLENPYAKRDLGNQGIYNGMLAVTIILSNFLIPYPQLKTILILLMFYISVVGIYGSLTVTKKIFFIQSLPAMITMLLIFITK